MSLPGLIDKLEDYLEYLKEEGARRVEVQAVPRVQRPPSSFETAQAAKPKPTSGPTQRERSELPLGLQYVCAKRLEGCSEAPDLRVLGNKTYFTSPHRDLLDKMFYAIGYTLCENKSEQPAVEITLGQTAIDYISGKKTPLLQKRGRWTKSGDLSVMPTLGPDYLAMEPKAKGEVWKDLLSVMDKLGVALPEWSAKYKK